VAMGDPPQIDPSKLTIVQILKSMTLPQIVGAATVFFAVVAAFVGAAYWFGQQQLRRPADPPAPPQATPMVPASVAPVPSSAAPTAPPAPIVSAAATPFFLSPHPSDHMTTPPKQQPPAPPASTTFNVSSTNQSGGQTAGVINNYVPPARRVLGRTVTGPIGQKLMARVVPALSINACNPDAEASQLAADFWDMAVQLKWDVLSRPNQVMSPDARRGVLIESTAQTGDHADPLLVLKDWLVSEGIPAAYQPGSRRNGINVWPQ
jgi:hypothetical protein